MADIAIQNSSFNKCSSVTVAANFANIVEGIKTLFFDLDNTLIPTRSGDLKAIRKLADVLEHKFSFTKELSGTTTQSFLKSFRRCPDNSQTSLDSWRTYLWREALPANFKHLADQIYPKWLQLRYRYLALPPEYVQLLRIFREAGYFLALITNGPSNAQWEKIHKLQVSQFFDCVLVSSDLPWEKPNPNIFHAACNFLGVKPAACAMIGDKLESDIKGGRLAGLGATFWLPLNSSDVDLKDVAYPPDIVLRQLVDIYKHFPDLFDDANRAINSTTISTLRHSQSARRVSQHGFSFSSNSGAACTGCGCCGNPTKSTWHCDREQAYQHHNANSNKYRRGGSLPAIEYFNSETEDSSDSLFN